MKNKEKHVLGLSGGKDSAALAVFMRDNHPEINIDYFFTDTGKELPEVYEYLSKLEGYLGKQIHRINPDRDFDFWLLQNNHFLPSPKARWCTIQLKLRPFEQWIKPFLEDGYEVYSYIAIRSDEDFREGYQSRHHNLITKLPFKDEGIDKSGVLAILEYSGLGIPDYYDWRSRSGCTFCFFQRKIEWVHLMEKHPQAFEEAKAYEKNAVDHGSPFTWSERESLEDLSKPDRVIQIKEDYKKRLDRAIKQRVQNPLRDNGLVDLDDLFGKSKVCLTCHK